MQHSSGSLEEIERALQDVNNSSLPPDRRKATEIALLAWRQQDAAWTTAHQLLGSSASPELVLFAAQTLRFKINEQAATMEQSQLQQLRDLLIQQLAKPPPHVAPLVLRQLCLALAGLAALLPAWTDVVEAAHTQLPQWHCLELLHSIAEDGSSDWRHVNVPGAIQSAAQLHSAITQDKCLSDANSCYTNQAALLPVVWSPASHDYHRDV
jgi:HPt (histidine-containing phosphotransfer) domain-containing protein